MKEPKPKISNAKLAEISRQLEATTGRRPDQYKDSSNEYSIEWGPDGNIKALVPVEDHPDDMGECITCMAIGPVCPVTGLCMACQYDNEPPGWPSPPQRFAEIVELGVKLRAKWRPTIRVSREEETEFHLYRTSDGVLLWLAWDHVGEQWLYHVRGREIQRLRKRQGGHHEAI